jgi:hypothetical protein
LTDSPSILGTTTTAQSKSVELALASRLSHKLLLLPPFSLPASQPVNLKHKTPYVRNTTVSQPSQKATHVIQQIHFFIMVVHFWLYLSFMIGYLEDETYISRITKIRRMTRLPHWRGAE